MPLAKIHVTLFVNTFNLIIFTRRSADFYSSSFNIAFHYRFFEFRSAEDMNIKFNKFPKGEFL